MHSQPAILLISFWFWVTADGYVGGSMFKTFAQKSVERFRGFLSREKIKIFNQLNTTFTNDSKIATVKQNDPILDFFNLLDKNNDSHVNDRELENWIRVVLLNYTRENCERSFNYYDSNKDGVVEWAEIYNISYAFAEKHANLSKSALTSLKQQMNRDKRRFKSADRDKNMKLNFSEFQMFTVPEFYDEMKAVVLKESFDRIDQNQDGFVDFDEFKREIMSEELEHDQDDSLLDQFADYDKDKNSKLSMNETKPWLSFDFDSYIASEVSQIFAAADDDKNGKLSIEELRRHPDALVGSEATQFGKLLKSPIHDEF